MSRRLTGALRRRPADHAAEDRAADRQASQRTDRAGTAPVTLLPDLGARVHIEEVPDHLFAELPALYSSLYSVVEYFRLFNGATRMCACVLDEPRHIVIFERHRRSVRLLNQLFDIDDRSARRACEAIFRAMPEVRRLRFNGSRLDVSRIGLPARVLARSTDVVIELPDDYDAYFRSLTKSTRWRLRSCSKRLREAYPAYEVLRAERAAITPELVHSVVELNRRRMAGKGDTCVYDAADEARLHALLRHYGTATTMVVDGRTIAGTLGSRVGADYYGQVQGFDPEFATFSPGRLAALLTIEDSISHGVRRFHLLWGTSEYKAHLGGTPQTLYAVAVYRGTLWKALDAAGAWRQVQSWAKDGPPSRWIAAARAWLGRNVKRRLLRRGDDAGEAAPSSSPPPEA